jgi:hypothetical protein
MRRHEHDLLVEEQRRIDREPRMRNQRVLRSDAEYSARLAGEMQESMALETRVRFSTYRSLLRQYTEGCHGTARG